MCQFIIAIVQKVGFYFVLELMFPLAGANKFQNSIRQKICTINNECKEQKGFSEHER